MKSKKLTCAYLYADGHAVLLYEKNDPDAGTIEYAEVHERWTEARLDFKGRLVFGRYDAVGLLRLAKMSKVIRAKEPTLERGSDNTRRMGIAVGYLAFDFNGGDGADTLHLNWLACISCGFNIQPETSELFDPKVSYWGNTRISKIHRIKTAKDTVTQ